MNTKNNGASQGVVDPKGLPRPAAKTRAALRDIKTQVSKWEHPVPDRVNILAMRQFKNEFDDSIVLVIQHNVGVCRKFGMPRLVLWNTTKTDFERRYFQTGGEPALYIPANITLVVPYVTTLSADNYQVELYRKLVKLRGHLDRIDAAYNFCVMTPAISAAVALFNASNPVPKLKEAFVPEADQ